MNQRWKWTSRGVVGFAVVLLAAGGCGGCEEEALNRVEERFREKPERPGKVGTLVGLEVVYQARDLAHQRMVGGDDFCDLGWDLDESFAVSFEFEVVVERSTSRRRWNEAGKWERDAQGQWLLQAGITFSEGDQPGGTREQLLFADNEGLWQWLGPEVVVYHQGPGDPTSWWEHSLAARFSSLVELVSKTWERPGGGERRVWIPGGERRRCGPASAGPIVDGWSPILNARASLEGATLRTTDREEGHRRCRVLEADYRLRAGGGEMKLQYRECLQERPETLERPQAGRVIEGRRDRSALIARREFERWIDKGLSVDDASDDRELR